MFRLVGLEPHRPQTFDEAMHAIEIEHRAEVIAHLRTAAVRDEPIDYHLTVRTPQGLRREFHARAQRVRSLSGQGTRVVGVVQDITDRKVLEDRLRQAERVSSLGRLAASVAHEFNNILMGIQPFAELILRAAPGEAPLQESATRIVDAVARGKRITQEILRFTRTPEPQNAVIDVEAWLASGHRELAQLAGQRVTITIEAEPGLRMIGDAHQLRQVFSNFITNARDAMPEGGTITIRANRHAARRQTDKGQYVHFAVTDSGHGMSPETIRMAFEPLFTTKQAGGTGLGLAIAHQIVRQHNGEIWAESVRGESSTFHVLIPAAAAEASMPAPTPAPVAPPAGQTLRRVVLVEDDATVAAGLAALLEMEDIRVDIVERGLDAVVHIASFDPDAVVLDVDLPDVSGVAVFDEIAKRWPALPVLFSTGHSDHKLVAHLLARPNVGLLLKPYDGVTLLQTLGQLRSC
jgi:signal transduction histidine kinase